MIHGTQRPRPPQAAIVAAMVLAIVAATLLPDRNGPLRPFSFCFTCEFRWLADGVLNVALFAPLGAAANWRGRSFWKVALAGLLLSTTIELLQLVVPGRDPSLRDIVANTLGAALGAALLYRPRAWLMPTAQRAKWLTAAMALVLGGVIVSTAQLLGPARIDVPPRVSRVDVDAVVRYRSRADVIGLDQPAYYARDMFSRFEPAGPRRVDVSRRRTGWCLSSAMVQRCQIGPTLGRGWAALIYPAAVRHRWADDLIDIAWTAILFFPLGFWITRRSIARSIGIAVVMLGIVPLTVGLVPTTLGEWLGASAAVVAGYAVAQRLGKRLTVVLG